MNNTIVYSINRVIVCAATSAAVFRGYNGATLQPLATSVHNDADICLVTMTAEDATAPARQQRPKKMIIFLKKVVG